MYISYHPPEGFLSEEVRSEYIISSGMKKAWAVQIDLLDQLKTVCAKYNLQYYADSGTLLGAIRHGGYIPWDDDIDIVMKRADYDRLIEIAPAEFSAPYFLQSSKSEFFPRGYARLRNSDTTAITRRDLGTNINLGIFIDIFPLDNVPDDMGVRNAWLKRIQHMYLFIKVGYEKQIKKGNSIFKNAAILGVRLLCRLIGYSRIMERYIRLCTRFNTTDSHYLSYVAYSRGKAKHIWNSSWFETSHSVPFEYTTIVVPDGYDPRLRTEYGDYMTPVQANTAHGSVILEPDIPYVQYLKDHSTEELKKNFV